MESFENLEVKVLKETVFHWRGTCDRVTLTQLKESYKGEIVYKTFSEWNHGGKNLGLANFYMTHNKNESDKRFSEMESEYPEEELRRKIF